MFEGGYTTNGAKQHTVPESYLLPGLTPKMCHYNACSILEDRFESLGMVPISSPMAWCGNQVKKYSIVSFRGKASSHGKGCLCVVLPPLAIVFMFRLRGNGSFFFLQYIRGHFILTYIHCNYTFSPTVSSVVT